MQDQVIEIPLIEPAWYNCLGWDERPYRLTDEHFFKENVACQLRDHRLRNRFASYGYCTERQARGMGRRIRPSQRRNYALVWFQDSNRPERFYNEGQLE